MATRPRHAEVWKNRTGRWYFHVVGGNGEVMEASQAYARKSAAVRAVRRLHAGIVLKAKALLVALIVLVCATTAAAQTTQALPSNYAYTLCWNGTVWTACASGGSGSNNAASATGSAVPAQASFTAMNISGILRGWTGLAVGSHFAGAMAIVDSAGNQISTFGGGTQYTEDAVAATDPVGTVPILVRTDTPTTAQVSANGDNIAQRGSNFGAAYTTLLDSAGNYASIGGGTQYANGSAQATPTGTTALGWDGANVRALSTTTTGALNTVMAGVSTPADGAANPTNTAPVSAYLLSYNGTTWDRARSSTDACDGGSKVFVAISQITSTQLLTGTASNKTHVCSLTIVQPAASTQTYSVVSGTGTVCATGAAAVLGGTTAATGLQQPIAFGSGAGTIAKSAVNADNVCLLQSGTDRLTGVLGYVVAP